GDITYYEIDITNSSVVDQATGAVTLDLDAASGTTAAPAGATPITAANTPTIPGTFDTAVNLTDASIPAGATLHRVTDDNGKALQDANGNYTYVLKSGDALYAVESVDEATGAVVAKQVTYTDAAGGTQTKHVNFGGADGKTEYVLVSGERYSPASVAGVDLQANPDELVGKQI